MTEQLDNENFATDPDDSQEEEVFLQYEIATYPSDFTLSGIHEMWHGEDITIPEFQRAFVWTIKQSSLLIESFLMGLPVPPVFFYIDEENRNLVIDGQQRILSTVFYIDGFFGPEDRRGRKQIFRLKGLNKASPYHEKTFAELPESHQRKLKSAVLRAINVRQLNPSTDNTSIYHVFERLNTGGTPLKPQEIRNCVFRGPIVTILRELNEDSNWRQIIGKPQFDKHQRDVELVLRVFALSRRDSEYEKPMKDYLNKAMKRNKKGRTSRIRRFQSKFPSTASTIIDQLGPKPFHVLGPLNTAALDSVFCTLLDNPTQIPKNLRQRFDRMLSQSDFMNLISASTTDTLALQKRFDTAREYLLKPT